MTLSEIRSRLAKAEIRGIAMLADPSPSFHLSAEPPSVRDARALYGDWKAVGDDLRTALKRASKGEQGRP